MRVADVLVPKGVGASTLTVLVEALAVALVVALVTPGCKARAVAGSSASQPDVEPIAAKTC